jgi:hypothetical protein
MCSVVWLWLQEFRAFSHGGKPKVLVMSYPCFRMHKAEVYRMGLDVVRGASPFTELRIDLRIQFCY